MSETTKLDRTEVSFAQAEGREQLPAQLDLKELSQELRAYLWLVVYKDLESATQNRGGYDNIPAWLDDRWTAILESWWILKEHKFADEFRNQSARWIQDLKRKFSHGDYVEIFDFLQFVIRHASCSRNFTKSIERALGKARAAYRLFDKTIVPITNEAEAHVLENALHELNVSLFSGSRSHLLSAGEFLTGGKWADSIRESIHAVESLLIAIEPHEKTLSGVLRRFEQNGKLNPNLKRSMNALYDYTSDEKGIRHAKIFENSDVEEEEALYMFGVCASFVTFATIKYRKEKLA